MSTKMDLTHRILCIICEEGIMDTKDVKPQIANCGHLFHGGCIEAWFQRCGEQKCPVCDQLANPRQAFLEVEGPVQTHVSRTEQLAGELKEEKRQTEIARLERDQSARVNVELHEMIGKLMAENERLQDEKENLKTEIRNLRTIYLGMASENDELEATNSELRKKIRQHQGANASVVTDKIEGDFTEEYSVEIIDISEDS